MTTSTRARDPFTEAIRDQAALRELYEQPTQLSATKETDRLDDVTRRLIACSPLVFVASYDADGRVDISPRGGSPGFVTVLDDRHLAIPDATGNRRLDTLCNVVATGRAGLIFVIPGRGQTLRVNGPAVISARPDLLEGLHAVGKPPRTAIVVRAEEVFAHCVKAFVRSRAWEPASWLPADAQPSAAEVSHAHIGDPALTVREVEEYQAESLRTRLL